MVFFVSTNDIFALNVALFVLGKSRTESRSSVRLHLNGVMPKAKKLPSKFISTLIEKFSRSLA
jgi:hypothetical protein